MALAGAALATCVGSNAYAHFQELIPSTQIASEKKDAKISFNIRFTHPMANGPIMEMGPPTVFGVLVNGVRTDLRSALKAKKTNGKSTYTADFKLARPAEHVFFIQPAPYWEPAEETMIIHYTKVVVNAFGADEGWSDMVGFPVEIMPLTRPYGLWTGNAFTGIVTKNGQPVPFADVEVEYRSEGKVKAPSDPYVTQVVRADGNGVFSYVMPRAGWWSFAALVTAEQPVKSPQGKDVPLEEGGLIWVRTVDMK
ncbi:MAG: DUF4198 domain-containing protein [Alphaproteobacteria bacterium]|nr:DUF4198 domain-containing protein [Alphaproteobacteria bacterium]